MTYCYYGPDSVDKIPKKGNSYFRTINHYDENKRLIKQDFISSPLRKKSASVTNTYDTHGFLIKQVHQGEAANDTIVTDYVNDENGNHLEVLPPTVNTSSETRRTYTYDRYNNPTSVVDYPYNEMKIFYDYTYYWYGNWTKRRMYADSKDNIYEIVLREINYY